MAKIMNKTAFSLIPPITSMIQITANYSHELFTARYFYAIFKVERSILEKWQNSVKIVEAN